MTKFVYLFKEGNADMRNLLGGKGANLAEMTNLGLPIPQGFTVTTEACTDYYNNGKQISSEIQNQIFEALTALLDDPSDRQIFISAWDNGKDGLGNRWTSNVPCPTCFSINIIDNKLNLTLFLRSSDTIVGLPYDMLMYSLLLIVFTHSLRKWYPNLQYGRIDAMLSHAHIYEAHYDIAKDLIKNAKSGIRSFLPDSMETSEVYRIQDIDLNNCSMLWQLQDLSNIVQDPNTAMIMFKDCIYSQFDGKQKFPPMYKPEIIK